MPQGKFATAVTCIDGRVQVPVIRWMMASQQVDYVDLVTEAGADKALAHWQMAQMLSIKEGVRLSVERHHSRLVAVVGHHDCAAAPGTREQHLQQIRAAVSAVRSWGFRAQAMGLWVNEKWGVEVVEEAQ